MTEEVTARASGSIMCLFYGEPRSAQEFLVMSLHPAALRACSGM